MTLRFAVIGAPIAHSRSPEMHRAAFAATGLDARYDKVRVEVEDLAEFIGGLAANGYRGINVTLPHKAAVIALLDGVDDAARAIGAVNTITVEDGALYGTNTDAPGLVRALTEAGFTARGREVLVLGAGGAARAAAYGLSTAGATRVSVAARRLEAAESLVADLADLADLADGADSANLAADCTFAAMALEGDALAAAFECAGLVVQATSATLAGNAAAASFCAGLPWDALADGATVVDLVYRPLETTVLEEARRRGHRAVDGLGMLVHQGALAFERWTGRPAPVAAMRAALTGA